MNPAKFTDRLRRINWLQPSVIALLIANCVPLAALFVFHWDVFSLLFLFWLENVIIGVFNVLKMLLAGIGAKDLPRYGAVVFGVLKFFMVPFFCMHYGLFTFVHGMFVVAIFDKGALHGFGGFSIQVITQIIHDNHLEWPLAALVVSHLIGFGWDYLWKGEFRRTNPLELMTAPYRRIVVMHLTVIIGAMLTMALHAPEAALLLLVVLKTITDLWGHQKERERLAVDKNSPTSTPATSSIRSEPSVQNILQAALQARAAQPSREEKRQGILIIAIIVIFYAGALSFAGFVTYNMVSGILSFGHPHPMPPRAPVAKKPAPDWTLGANHALIPETPAAGNFRGSAFHVSHGTLAGQVLTLSDTSDDTNRAFVIHFTPEQMDAMANRIFKIAADDVADVPEVELVTHVKHSKGTEIRTFHRGYSMQWQLGVKGKSKVPLKIYLSLPDAEKSFVAGTFNVAIKTDKTTTNTTAAN